MHDKKTGKNHLNVTNIESNNGSQYVLSRANVEKYLRELSDHVHLEGEIIVPKPIDAHLVKLSTLRAETKLFSSTALVGARRNIHALPLRCPSKDNMKTATNSSNTHHWLEDKVNQLTATVEQLTKRLNEIRNQTSEPLTEVKKECTNRVAKTEEKWTLKADELNNRITMVQQTLTPLEKQIATVQRTLSPLEMRITEIQRIASQQSKELETRIVTLQEKAAVTITKGE
jgi:DNA repair exonuclease SbcCD ATPase subunit